MNKHGSEKDSFRERLLDAQAELKGTAVVTAVLSEREIVGNGVFQLRETVQLMYEIGTALQRFAVHHAAALPPELQKPYDEYERFDCMTSFAYDVIDKQKKEKKSNGR